MVELILREYRVAGSNPAVLTNVYSGRKQDAWVNASTQARAGGFDSYDRLQCRQLVSGLKSRGCKPLAFGLRGFKSLWRHQFIRENLGCLPGKNFLSVGTTTTPHYIMIGLSGSVRNVPEAFCPFGDRRSSYPQDGRANGTTDLDKSFDARPEPGENEPAETGSNGLRRGHPERKVADGLTSE